MDILASVLVLWVVSVHPATLALSMNQSVDSGCPTYLSRLTFNQKPPLQSASQSMLHTPLSTPPKNLSSPNDSQSFCSNDTSQKTLPDVHKRMIAQMHDILKKGSQDVCEQVENVDEVEVFESEEKMSGYDPKCDIEALKEEFESAMESECLTLTDLNVLVEKFYAAIMSKRCPRRWIADLLTSKSKFPSRDMYETYIPVWDCKRSCEMLFPSEVPEVGYARHYLYELFFAFFPKSGDLLVERTDDASKVQHFMEDLRLYHSLHYCRYYREWASVESPDVMLPVSSTLSTSSFGEWVSVESTDVVLPISGTLSTSSN